MKSRTYNPLFIYLFICLSACNLFNNNVDTDFINKIDKEIAWANAHKLNVTVVQGARGEIWGSSPQNGNGSRDNQRSGETPRMGYPFNVEFEPNTGYDLVEWLAFDSGSFGESIGNFLSDLSNEVDYEEAVQAHTLNGNGVDTTPKVQTHTGSWVQTVTVNIAMDVTLVPWCSDRLRVIHSNPPLINNGLFYTRNQEIRIWFSVPLDGDTVGFGEDLIMIRGNNISDGLSWSTDGDLRQFYNVVYNTEQNFVSIVPHGNPSPPPNLNITVSIGTGIAGSSVRGMASPVNFSFRISNEEVTKAYKANNIWAVHDPVNDRRVESFFYQTAPSDRDRRLRKNAAGDYEVSLYFSVSRSMGEIENPEPDAICITQIHFADIRGVEFFIQDKQRRGDKGIQSKQCLGRTRSCKRPACRKFFLPDGAI